MADEHSNWSHLPADILESIVSTKLSSFLDIISIKLVCSSWRGVISQMKNRNKLHELVYYSVSESRMFQDSVRFVGVDDKKFPSFEKTLPSLFLHEPIIGSHPGGWLIKVINQLPLINHDEGIRIYICNLITEISIRLPDILARGSNVTSEMWFPGTHRAIMSHNPCRHRDFIVAIISPLRKQGGIYLWSQGNRVWSPLRRDIFELKYIDIAFVNYSFYALTDGNPFIIEKWDFMFGLGCHEKKMSVRLSGDSSFNMRNFPYWTRIRLVLTPSAEIFIVHSLGFLTSRREWKLFGVDLGNKTCRVSNSLNGGALLYGDMSSIFVSSLDVQRYGYYPNSIYYVRSYENMLMMYSLEDDQDHEIWTSSLCSSFLCWMDVCYY